MNSLSLGAGSTPAETPVRGARTARTAGMPMRVLTALVLGAGMVGAAHAGTAGLAPVIKSANTFTATVTGIALALATGAIGIGGYKIMFQGAAFRDVANLFVGAAVCLSAAAIAAIFV